MSFGAITSVELDAVVVVTAESSGRRDAHDLTDALIEERIAGLR